MSHFALLAQAAGLLGQALRHISRSDPDQARREREAIQLDRTLHALINAAEEVKPSRCDPIGICYRYIVRAYMMIQLTFCSALMALHGHHLSSSDPSILDSGYYFRSKSVTQEIAKIVTAESLQHLSDLKHNTERLSPWGLQLLYQASVTCIRSNRETPTLESADALNILHQTLVVFDSRWKVAGRPPT